VLGTDGDEAGRQREEHGPGVLRRRAGVRAVCLHVEDGSNGGGRARVEGEVAASRLAA
jgi:hypothetical protein